MKVAIVYTSITGNTKELSHWIYESFKTYSIEVSIYTIEEFSVETLNLYQGIMIGTYTWGDGIIPKEMELLYQSFENKNTEHITTAIFGTGDSFYSSFCGAVNHFRDMLYFHTKLAVTLKVELRPQEQDKIRCMQFVELFVKRLYS